MSSRFGPPAIAISLFSLLLIAPVPESSPELQNTGFPDQTRAAEIETVAVKEQAVSAVLPDPPDTPQPTCSCCGPARKHSIVVTESQPEPGEWTVESIPASNFREELLAADSGIRDRAMEQFNRFGMSTDDIDSLHVGPDGSLFFACRAQAVSDDAEPVYLDESVAQGDPVTPAAGVPVASPPVYHSKPNAPYAIYLDFNGATISGTAWNSGGNTLYAYAWSKDSDATTFSDSEQDTIRRIWQRMAEDYAPFNVNVTTDPSFDPDATGGDNDIGWVLFTRDEATDGEDMPARGAGGVAYVGVFGERNYYRYYSPAFVYADNLGPNNEHFMAEAGSHEMGHNMGLSHDGGGGKSYYAGHSAGNYTWGAIMGSSYRDDITTWTKGEYTGATQTQDDTAIIINRVGAHPDEAGSSVATATELVFSGNDLVDPLTRAYVGDDPNEGVVDSASDVDMYSFSTTGGAASFTVETFVAEETRLSYGANLDVKLSLLDESGNVILTSDPQTTLSASLNTTLAAGNYAIAIEGTGFGNPMASSPTGYTEYGSMGMYFITGNAAQTGPPPYVTSQAPVPENVLSAPVDSVTFYFSKPMDISTFDLSTDLISFNGPQGADLLGAVSSLSWNTEGTALTVVFAEQSIDGNYEIVLAPSIQDLEGNALDNDQDQIGGELEEDRYTGSFALDVPTPAENWREMYFSSPVNSGDGADDNDFDKDGVINALERAFATNPTTPGSVYRPVQSIEEAESLDYLALEYVRPTGGTGATGVDYTHEGMTFTVEYTSDLSTTWESGQVTVVSVSPPENGMETVVVRLNTDLATQPRQFIRLNVSGPE